jgi:hypothetical protein
MLSWFKCFPFSALLIGSRDSTFAVARPLQRAQAENYIVALSSLHSAATFSFSRQQPIVASDTSMLLSPALFLEARWITCAATTPYGRVALSLARHGSSGGILHGELLGTIGAILLPIHANINQHVRCTDGYFLSFIPRLLLLCYSGLLLLTQAVWTPNVSPTIM